MTGKLFAIHGFMAKRVCRCREKSWEKERRLVNLGVEKQIWLGARIDGSRGRIERSRGKIERSRGRNKWKQKRGQMETEAGINESNSEDRRKQRAEVN